jgi:hypothetical protein
MRANQIGRGRVKVNRIEIVSRKAGNDKGPIDSAHAALWIPFDPVLAPQL